MGNKPVKVEEITEEKIETSINHIMNIENFES